VKLLSFLDYLWNEASLMAIADNFVSQASRLRPRVKDKVLVTQ